MEMEVVARLTYKLSRLHAILLVGLAANPVCCFFRRHPLFDMLFETLPLYIVLMHVAAIIDAAVAALMLELRILNGKGFAIHPMGVT
jgi:hypothetical protein